MFLVGGGVVGFGIDRMIGRGPIETRSKNHRTQNILLRSAMKNQKLAIVGATPPVSAKPVSVVICCSSDIFGFRRFHRTANMAE